MINSETSPSFAADPILSLAKEVQQTKDTLEVAKLLQSGNWVVVRALSQGDEIEWILIRYR